MQASGEGLHVRMKALREEHGRSQADAARALGVSQPSYWAMENGDTPPKRRDLVTLAVLYGMDVEDAFPNSTTEE